MATPIGNARDITLRALEVIRNCDILVAEDTRETQKLLALHGIQRSLRSYHAHTETRDAPKLAAAIRDGASVAIVSDAGTPLVSDPGGRLVAEAIAAGVSVTALPGPSAAITALVLSGLPAEPFLFLGFLPAKGGERRETLRRFATVPATLVLYEAPHRLAESLADLASILGARDAAVTRELTKLYEEVRRGKLDVLSAHYAEADMPRGEIAIVIGPPAGEAPDAGAALDTALDTALGAMSFRQAVADVASRTGLPRRVVYAAALRRKAVLPEDSSGDG